MVRPVFPEGGGVAEESSERMLPLRSFLDMEERRSTDSPPPPDEVEDDVDDDFGFSLLALSDPSTDAPPSPSEVGRRLPDRLVPGRLTEDCREETDSVRDESSPPTLRRRLCFLASELNEVVSPPPPPPALLLLPGSWGTAPVLERRLVVRPDEDELDAVLLLLVLRPLTDSRRRAEVLLLVPVDVDRDRDEDPFFEDDWEACAAATDDDNDVGSSSIFSLREPADL